MPCWIRPLHSKVEFIIQRRVVLAFKKFALCMFLYRINKYFISINKSNMFNSFTHSIPLGLQINTVSWKIKPRVTLCFSVYPYQFQLVSCALVSFFYQNFKSYLLTSGRAMKPRINEKSTVESPFFVNTP